MMLYNFAIRVHVVSLLLCLFFPSHLLADEPVSTECRPLETVDTDYKVQTKYAEGLLWEVHRPGTRPSYVFGTIHVSDPEIVNLPGKINDILSHAGQFTMEALPEPNAIIQLTQMMFFSDGRKLDEFIAPRLFDRTVEILANYRMPIEAVMMMKPWAAFMVMNYPAGDGLPMDLKLLAMAQQNGIEVNGLESLLEQGKIFDEMAFDTQLKLLIDTVCHYDLVLEDIEQMKSMYIKRDLQGLYAISRRYSLSEEPMYQELIKKILTDRNVTMVERMQPILDKGNSFIAIGALHLPGDDGVLSLLEQKGYAIKSIY
ncbi:MAG: TraB/GumN family protein [Gammaproteobacteria bacterium]